MVGRKICLGGGALDQSPQGAGLGAGPLGKTRAPLGVCQRSLAQTLTLLKRSPHAESVHSYRSESTGSARAARNDWDPTVSRATARVSAPANTKVPGRISTG